MFPYVWELFNSVALSHSTISLGKGILKGFYGGLKSYMAERISVTMEIA
jgi:hypothetical protein